MLGFLHIILLCFIVGIAALVFSILAYRLKTEVMFWCGVAFTGIMVLIVGINFRIIYLMLLTGDALMAIVIFTCVILPVGFLVASRLKPQAGSGTELTDDYIGGPSAGSGEVTQEYLDEIINSPDEDIKFD